MNKVISGGQTGVDQTGVEEAAKKGYKTGGTMPRDFRTEDGPNPEWAKKYGLKQHTSSSYPPRTRINVYDAEATVWFGSVDSAGYRCTRDAAERYGRPFYPNPTPGDFRTICESFGTINIAGNRASTHPEAMTQTRVAFEAIPERKTD